MPCLAVIHLRGNDNGWNSGDVVQVFTARKRAGEIEAYIGNVWMKDLGSEGNRQFLALYLPDDTLTEARIHEGRGMANVNWENHFTARERDNILDRTITVPFQERPAIGRAILRKRI